MYNSWTINNKNHKMLNISFITMKKLKWVKRNKIKDKKYNE